MRLSENEISDVLISRRFHYLLASVNGCGYTRAGSSIAVDELNFQFELVPINVSMGCELD